MVTRLAPLDAQHPENRGVLSYLASRRPNVPAIQRPSDVLDPEQGAGAHPDVVERLWRDLGTPLPRAARALVFGTPGLVHPHCGLVLAVALGTSYALRLPPEALAAAQERGLHRAHRFATMGYTLDLGTFGPTWRFGAWLDIEREWIASVATRLG
jgi:hypothetical protein